MPKGPQCKVSLHMVCPIGKDIQLINVLNSLRMKMLGGYQGHSQSWDNMFSNAYNSDWRDYSDYMWGEPQQFQQDGYWQQKEEFYSRLMQPPQPHPQQFQSNSSMSLDNDMFNKLLTSLN
ncbi:hypothetical protein PS2_018554 [Malus domestica]